MNFKLLSIASFFFVTFSCSQKQSPVDLTTVVQPFGVIPSSQNGYGGGLDQLAQPDDVEILSNGSFVITDVDNNRIQLFSSDGSLLKSVSAKHLGLKISEQSTKKFQKLILFSKNYGVTGFHQ